MSREENLQKLNMQKHTSSVTIGGREITFETGYMAKQAAGSVVVSCDETMVMSNATDGDPRPRLDFFPLMVDTARSSTLLAAFSFYVAKLVLLTTKPSCVVSLTALCAHCSQKATSVIPTSPLGLSATTAKMSQTY